jgi:hypothetical protein
MSAFGSKADIAQGRRDGGLRGQGQPWFRHRIRLAFDTDRPEGVIDPEDGTLFWFAETAKEIWTDILHWQAACGARSSASLDRKRHSAPFWPTQGRKH